MGSGSHYRIGAVKQNGTVLYNIPSKTVPFCSLPYLINNKNIICIFSLTPVAQERENTRAQARLARGFVEAGVPTIHRYSILYLPLSLSR
jgi:hypothetical protein